jgi:cytochrome P450
VSAGSDIARATTPDFLSADVIRDPFPSYARLRATDPVHFSAPLGAFLLTRYADVLAALRDPRLSSRRAELYFARMPDAVRAELDPFARSLALWTIFQDPPDHTRLRALLGRAFTARLVEGLRPRIAAVVDRLLAPLLGRGSMDVVRELAYPLPAIIVAEMLGVAERDLDRLKGWSDDIGVFLGSNRREPEVGRRALEAWRDMTEHMRGVIAARRRAPEADLISALIAAEEAGSVHAEDELLATTVMLLFAGHETTTNLIANGLAALLADRPRLDELRREPALLPSAIEELLRFAGPLQLLSRVAREPLEISGRAIPAGARVMLMLGAANRDPAQFGDPERLDLRREPNRHVAFGYGAHFCIGGPLARIEAEVAIGALLARTADLRGPAGPLEWNANMGLRGLARLPVTFGAG